VGGTSYSFASAENTRSIKGTFSNSIDENFKQNKLRRAHESMKSQGITLREARDSDVHPATFPIIIALDLTGSMGDIPQLLIKTGLPKLISNLIQGGIQSPAVLFIGVGDHEWDGEPLQIGQFESGDKELDLWLERTYLEGGGGSNRGESYGLAHYFAARHCETAHWDERAQKGVLITIGDEPSLTSYPAQAMSEIMGNKNVGAFSDEEILAEAQEKWEVYHIDPRDGMDYRGTNAYWTNLLGQNYVKTADYTEIPKLATDIILNHAPKGTANGVQEEISEESPLKEGSSDQETEEIL